jgi:hypothetical protein
VTASPEFSPIRNSLETLHALQSSKRGSGDDSERSPLSIGMIAGIAGGVVAIIAIAVVILVMKRAGHSITISHMSSESGGGVEASETVIETGAGLEFYVNEFSSGRYSIGIPDPDLFAMSDD